MDAPTPTTNNPGAGIVAIFLLLVAGLLAVVAVRGTYYDAFNAVRQIHGGEAAGEGTNLGSVPGTDTSGEGNTGSTGSSTSTVGGIGSKPLE